MTVTAGSSPPSVACPAPRELFLVTDAQTRDLGVADAVVDGRFTQAGVTLELGLDPDWTSNPYPADEEWRIEWSKFYYGLDLAHACAHRGDSRYLDAWVRLVSGWIDQVPFDRDTCDVASRRIQNWIYAWSRFGHEATATGLDPGFVDILQASLLDQAAHVRRNLSQERNHRTLELYALFVVAVALPALDESRELLDFSVSELYRNLCYDFLPDGVHRELSTHYHAIVLRSFLGLRINADRFGIDLPADYDRRVIRACEFLAAVIRPDGSLPMLSDSDDADHRHLLAVAGHRYDRADLLFVATDDPTGPPPPSTADVFADSGYCVARSPWTAPAPEQRHMVFDCGPVGDSGHGHYDALHLELSSARPLLVDPGRFTYSEDDLGDGTNWRRWFKGTAAHNTVTVDGVDQTAYRKGKPKAPTARTHLLEHQSSDGVLSFVGEVHSPEYDVIHRRQVLFIDRSWWLIDDALIAGSRHRYDLRWHFAPEAQGSTTLADASASGRGVTARAPGLTLTVLSEGPADATLEPGFVAPEYGVRVAAPILSVTARAATTRLVSVVVPSSNAEPERVSGSLAQSGGTVSVERLGSTRMIDLSDPLFYCRRAS